MINDKEIKQEFIKAIDGRVQLILDDNYWDYLLNEYEFDYGYKTEYERFKAFIEDKFKGDIQLYKKEIAELNRNIIPYLSVMQSTYPKISQSDYNDIIVDFAERKKAKDKSIVMEEGAYYLTIDLKDAFTQMIDYFHLCGNLTFNDAIGKCTKVPEIITFRGNKLNIYNRVEDSMGNLRTYKMLLIILSKIYDTDDELINYIKDNNLVLSKILGDELYFKLGDKMTLNKTLINKYCKGVVNINGFDCHVNIVKYGKIHYTYNGIEKYMGYYDNYLTKSRKFHNKTCIYLWQLNKLYKGETLNEKDMYLKDGQGYMPFIDKIEILSE